MDDIENDPLIQMGVTANLAQRAAGDQQEFIEFLARDLERALPTMTETTYRGGLFSRKKLASLQVCFDNELLTAEVTETGVNTSCTKVVRGIKLKTEPMPMQEWLALLIDRLNQHAEKNGAARDALEKLFQG